MVETTMQWAAVSTDYCTFVWHLAHNWAAFVPTALSIYAPGLVEATQKVQEQYY
jgi:hypothetical protein